MLDPLDGAERLENGAIFYKIEDKELNPIITKENILRAEYNRLKNTTEVMEVSDEEENSLRLALLEEME
jgi:hypothetical protein